MDQQRVEDWTCRACGYVEAEAKPGARCPECATVLVPAGELERAPHDPVLGGIIGGKYAVIGVLGTGGFGTVYRAVQDPVGREVALKLVHAHHAKDPDLRARFFREARIVARLSDPTVVTLFDYGDEPELGLYCVFELVAGHTLKAYVDAGPQEPVWVAQVMLQLLGALGEAHAMGMVHRDIKPANVMVVTRSDGERRVRLLDFGIAKVLPVENSEQSVQTQQGVVIGTPEYLSPEQARAKDEVDGRSDIYSVGVLAYTLLAGANPFSRGSIIDTILAHCSVAPPPLDPSLAVPPELEALVHRALEKRPEDRFQSAAEMRAAVQDVFPRVGFASGVTPAPIGTSLGAGSGSGGASAHMLAGPPTTSSSGALSEVVGRGGSARWAAPALLVLLLLGGVAIFAFGLGSAGRDQVISRPLTTEDEPETPRSEDAVEPTEPEAPSPEVIAAPAASDPVEGDAPTAEAAGPRTREAPPARPAREIPRRRTERRPPPRSAPAPQPTAPKPAAPERLTVPEF